MSPTSYQTAPPRTSIIANACNIVNPGTTEARQFMSASFRVCLVVKWFALKETQGRIHWPIRRIEQTLNFMASKFRSLLRSKEKISMPKKDPNPKAPARERGGISAQPRLHQRAAEIQEYGTVSHMLPLDLEEPVRLEMTEQLNLLLADTMTLRDLYKKSHWQVAGPTFYQLHLLF